MEYNIKQEKSEIVNAALFIDALKSSGYTSTYNAIAEIVDNSIDAKAKDVFVIGEQAIAANREKRIVSFAFLDNGTGMDIEKLQKCLTIGYTTNQARTGMGRFGVGLPQASIFVCDRVEVYSWQDGIENCMMVYLDTEEVKTNNLNEISPAIKKMIPDKYINFLDWKSDEKEFNFKEHGTLVIWTKCTAVDHKKWNTCVHHMSQDLGRKYRYFLNDDSLTISMIELVGNSYQKLLPNDPLYLLEKSQESMPEIDQFIKENYESKPYNPSTGYKYSMFELYKPLDDSTGIVDLEIKYEEKDEIKTGIARIKYSVVKRKYYAMSSLNTETKPGKLLYGKSPILISNTGVSIVRNGREIDFGCFGFYDQYNVPDYRWWGIEISFNSDLDYAFGISNNKQHVNLKALSKQDMDEIGKDDLKSVWHQLYDELKNTIYNMTQRNSSIREEKVNLDDPLPPDSSDISNVVDQENGMIFDDPLDMSEEEKEEKAKEQLQSEGIETPTQGQIKQYLDSKVRVVTVFNKTKRDSFIDYKFEAGTLSIQLNSNHIFYEKLVKKIMSDDNDKTAFELFVMSVVKSIKDLDSSNPDVMDSLMYKINTRIQAYMVEYNIRNA